MGTEAGRGRVGAECGARGLGWDGGRVGAELGRGLSRGRGGGLSGHPLTKPPRVAGAGSRKSGPQRGLSRKPRFCSASEASCLGVAKTRKLRPAARDTAKVTRWPGFEPSSCLF